MRATPAGALAAALLASAVVGGCSASDHDSRSRAPTPSASAGVKPSPDEPTVRLALLPGVAQPGPAATFSPEGPLLVATARPVRAGGDVLLQHRVGHGWETVARAQQDIAGVARFGDSLPGDVSEGAFRAAVVGRDGAVEQVSDEVEGARWTTVFADEFDDTSLDTTRWNYRSVGVYNLQDDGRCSRSDPAAVQVAEGTLRLQVRRDPERMHEKCRTPDHGQLDYYLNGRVDTEEEFAFTHGVAAARVKFQRGQGQHGAFWLQRSGGPVVPGDPASSGAEIDVAEFFGDGAKHGGMGTYVYYADEQGKSVKIGGIQPDATQQLPPGDSWWTRFHVFSVEWTPQRYVYRVDGREVFRTTEGLSNRDEFLVLSLSTKDWELAKLDQSLLPSTMEVDWVRVWQRFDD